MSWWRDERALLQERQLIQAAPIPLEPWLPVVPDQLVPDHFIPDHFIPDQPIPDQPFPDQPFSPQLFPDQQFPDPPITDSATYSIWASNVETVRLLLDDLL